jgi:excisionase family DNA binding protein
VTRPKTPGNADRLLTVEAAAERMSTSVRFVRRLIAERRIAFVKLGRHVRLTEADVAAFIESGRITPLDASPTWHNDRKVS